MAACRACQRRDEIEKAAALAPSAAPVDPYVQARLERIRAVADLAPHFACSVPEATRNARHQLDSARSDLADARAEVARLEKLERDIDAALAECGDPEAT